MIAAIKTLCRSAIASYRAWRAECEWQEFVQGVEGNRLCRLKREAKHRGEHIVP